MWILSAYGPGRNAPSQLFGGYPREQSFEELRLRHYDLAAVGNQQQAIQEAQSWVKSAEQQMQTALNNVDGAIRYIIDGENQHPNRHDVCKAAALNVSQQAATSNQHTAISGSSQVTSSNLGRPSTTFGQPSTPVSTLNQSISLGQPKSLFGQPNPISGQAPAFGQPSVLGPPPGTTFGQSSSLNSAFRQATAPPPFGSAQEGLSLINGQPAPETSISRPSNPFGQPPFLHHRIPRHRVFLDSLHYRLIQIPSVNRACQSLRRDLVSYRHHQEIPSLTRLHHHQILLLRAAPLSQAFPSLTFPQQQTLLASPAFPLRVKALAKRWMYSVQKPRNQALNAMLKVE